MEEKIQIEGHVENINGAPEAFISSLENATGISLGWSWGENGAIDFSGDDLAEADCVNTIRPVCSRFASRYAIAVEVGDHVTLVCKGKKMKTTGRMLVNSIRQSDEDSATLLELAKYRATEQ